MHTMQIIQIVHTMQILRITQITQIRNMSALNHLYSRPCHEVGIDDHDPRRDSSIRPHFSFVCLSVCFFTRASLRSQRKIHTDLPLQPIKFRLCRRGSRQLPGSTDRRRFRWLPPSSHTDTGAGYSTIRYWIIMP